MISVIFRQLDLQLQAHLEKMTYIITNPIILRHPLFTTLDMLHINKALDG